MKLENAIITNAIIAAVKIGILNVTKFASNQYFNLIQVLFYDPYSSFLNCISSIRMYVPNFYANIAS